MRAEGLTWVGDLAGPSEKATQELMSQPQEDLGKGCSRQSKEHRSHPESGTRLAGFEETPGHLQVLGTNETVV